MSEQKLAHEGSEPPRGGRDLKATSRGERGDGTHPSRGHGSARKGAGDTRRRNGACAGSRTRPRQPAGPSATAGAGRSALGGGGERWPRSGDEMALLRGESPGTRGCRAPLDCTFKTAGAASFASRAFYHSEASGQRSPWSLRGCPTAGQPQTWDVGPCGGNAGPISLCGLGQTSPHRPGGCTARVTVRRAVSLQRPRPGRVHAGLSHALPRSALCACVPTPVPYKVTSRTGPGPPPATPFTTPSPDTATLGVRTAPYKFGGTPSAHASSHAPGCLP